MTTVEVRRLTEEQKEILKRTFQEMEDDSARNGLSVFIRLFQDYPQYKNLWSQFKTIPDSSLIHSDLLKTHARLFMSGLRDIIINIDDEQALSAQLHRIAAAHQRRGVRKSHVENILPTTLAVLHVCMNALTPEVEDAWTTLFGVIADIIERMRKGITTPV